MHVATCICIHTYIVFVDTYMYMYVHCTRYVQYAHELIPPCNSRKSGSSVQRCIWLISRHQQSIPSTSLSCATEYGIRAPSCKAQGLRCFSRENSAHWQKSRHVWQKAPQYVSHTNPEANHKSAAHFLSKKKQHTFFISVAFFLTYMYVHVQYIYRIYMYVQSPWQ